MGSAPDDIDLLLFAMEWRVNPEELRQNWSARDIAWLQMIPEAQRLAAKEMARRAEEKTARGNK